MKRIEEDPIRFSKARLFCNRTVLPRGLKVGNVELGKGSNNRVVEATWNDEPCAIRMPRRQSDTQQKGAATWEVRHTLKASQLGVSPNIYAAWYAKHATRDFPSGLYIVTDVFSHDYENLLMSNSRREQVLERSDDIAMAIIVCLEKLANANLFVYDLKPSNVVVRLEEDGGVTAKIIDFGRDFCEWGGTKENDASTPTIDLINNLTQGDETLRAHILFAVMLVELAATTTNQLYEDRKYHRMDADVRSRINGLARAASSFLDSMQGSNLAIVRQVLRSDDVKGVLRHYHGRRNSGTRRTFRLCRGAETK